MKIPSARLAAALAALTLGLAACGGAGSAPDEPTGILLSARAEDLGALLAAAQQLEGTPLARTARELAARLPDCPELEARAPEGDVAGLFENLRCRPEPSALEALHAERGDAGLALVWPLEPGMRARGRLRLQPGGAAELALSIPRDAATGVRGLFLPGEAPPGPGVLSATGALFHARLRPAGGLALASLVPEGGQGDQLFRLRSELFAGAVLDGTWEAAVYLPAPGERVPRAALALGFVHRGVAVAAMESFLGEIQRSWPVRRSAIRVGDAEGACLLDLRIMPEFAPCYVASRNALVVGYNPASLRQATSGGAPSGSGGGLVLELARFAEADARLARSHGTKTDVPPAGGRWTRLRAEGRAADDAIELRVHLDPAGAQG